MKLLRGIAPDLPDLRFDTQQMQGSARPDMWGLDGATARVFIENKFWAGLTENQPVAYLRGLTKYPQPSVLLMVVPAERQEAVWRELVRRLSDAEISSIDRKAPTGVVRVSDTDLGPTLALTSWSKVLAAIEAELADEPTSMNDLLQLRALCDAADQDAFVPLSSTELTDQSIPALVLQLRTIVQHAIEVGITEGVLSIDGLGTTSGWERIGRYISFPSARGVGAWIGTNFLRWRQNGCTPIWLVFAPTEWGRAHEVRSLLEPWADREGIAHAMQDGRFAIGIDLATGEELDGVVRSLVGCLRVIAEELAPLPAHEG
jgi:hypothetical protein